jgi:hypothetical protein
MRARLTESDPQTLAFLRAAGDAGAAEKWVPYSLAKGALMEQGMFDGDEAALVLEECGLMLVEQGFDREGIHYCLVRLTVEGTSRYRRLQRGLPARLEDVRLAPFTRDRLSPLAAARVACST